MGGIICCHTEYLYALLLCLSVDSAPFNFHFRAFTPRMYSAMGRSTDLNLKRRHHFKLYYVFKGLRNEEYFLKKGCTRKS